MPFKHLSIVCFTFLCLYTNAQTDTLKFDTSYYERYPHKLILTPFLVNNNTSFSVLDNNDKLTYSSNMPMGIGFRIGYDWLAVSASYGVGFIDPVYKKESGKTKALNLNTSFLAKKLLIDLYFQKHKGMFMQNDLLSNAAYTRPDLQSKIWGGTVSYVFNGKKFSPRPAFKFDTWQKKSAGSFIAGIEFLSGEVSADSAFVPKPLQNTFTANNLHKTKYLLFGPNIGYGHNFVIGKHFFITALASLNADVSVANNYFMNTSPTKSWGFSPSINARGGIGYNTENWEIAASYFGKRLYLNSKDDNRFMIQNNDYRLSFTKRINAGKRIPNTVNWAGNIIEKLGFGFLIR